MAMSRLLQEQIEPTSAKPVTIVDDRDALIYGMKWPANRLTSGQMRTLRMISKDVRTPITQLLKDAVDVYLSLIEREMKAIMVAESGGKSADEPILPQPRESPVPLALPEKGNTSRPRQRQLF